MNFFIPSKSNLKAPLNIGLGFTLFTLVIFVFGPFDFPNFCGPILYVFLFVNYFAIYKGFTKGYQGKIVVCENLKPFPLRKFINTLFWVSLIIALPKFLIYAHFPDLSPSALIARASMFFTDAQELYLDKLDQASSVTGVWRIINWIIVLAGPLSWAYTIIAVVFWKRLTTFQKIGTIYIWLLYALEFLLTGTNFGLFDLFISIGVAYIASNLRNTEKKKRLKKKGKLSGVRLFLLLGALIYLLIWIFDTSMSSRIGDSFYYGGEVAGVSYGLNTNSFLWNICPPSLRPVLTYLAYYVAKPYSALSVALTLPFEPTFGVGYSWFLLDNVPFSDFFWERTYPMRIEHIYRYSHTINWHTAYTWFANDISFFLVPVLFFYLFRLFGKAWKEYLTTGNIGSFLLFMIYVKMMFFLSANNQVFQGSATTFAFWILIFTRKKFRSFNYDEQ